MFRHCRHPQEAYTKISLKHTEIHNHIFIDIHQYKIIYLLKHTTINKYALLYFFMKSWFKIPKDSDNAKTFRSQVIERIHEL